MRNFRTFNKRAAISPYLKPETTSNNSRRFNNIKTDRVLGLSDIRKSGAITETFNQDLQFRPYKLYQIVDSDGKYALTCEAETKSVFLSKPDPTNKNQWVFLDSDTGGDGKSGVIAFFNQQDGYFDITLTQGTIYANRGPSINNGMFSFNINNSGYLVIKLLKTPEYCLAYRLPGSTTSSTDTTKTDDGKTTDGTDATPNDPTKPDTPADDGKDGTETFDAKTEPQLEIVKYSGISKEYSYLWKCVEAADLKEYVNKVQNMEDSAKIIAESGQKLSKEEQLLAAQKLYYEREIEYMKSVILNYEKLLPIKMFLKKSALDGLYKDPNPADTTKT